MLVRDAIVQRMVELDIARCAGVAIDGYSRPIVTETDPRMDEVLGDRSFLLLGEVTNAQQADIDRGLIRTWGSHVCYDGCEELED